MDPQPHRLARAKEIFADALDRSAGDRAAFLNAACAGDTELRAVVDALLEAHAAAERFMDSPSTAPELAAATTAASANTEQPGSMIGPYKLLEQIGEGGFGVVFMAEQREPVVRKVALKVIKLGMDTRQVVARFEAERQALAMMDHPNIAKVLDAGATETGRPYFVMELVRGDPITEYCDRNNLSTAERLDLFTQVCHAVQHAHQKGIIHRDIKPSNVLVTMFDGCPVPKVIDFGIAKAMNQRLTDKTLFTAHRQLIGTPAYMSPEQAEMSGVDIDTRSDIYSLGVLLYELLTGTTPFDPAHLRSAALAEVARIIREEEPPKPSTRLSSLQTLPSIAAHRSAEPARLSALVRGDLDWIAMKCLEKDRTRRYETANGLALDVQRHLAGELVTAVPPSPAYRVRKFVRRHRVGVLAGAAIVLAVLSGIIGTAAGLLQAREESRRARASATAEETAKQQALTKAEETELVARFQEEQLSGFNLTDMARFIRTDLAERNNRLLNARKGLTEEQRGQEAAAFEETIRNLDIVSVCASALDLGVADRALRAANASFGDRPLLKARLLSAISNYKGMLGKHVSAVAVEQEALAIRTRLLGDVHPDTLSSVINLGEQLRYLGKPDEAEPLLKTALQRCRETGIAEKIESLRLASALSLILDRAQKYADAERLAREVLEGARHTLEPNDHFIVAARNNLGINLVHQRRYAEAEPLFQECLESGRRLGDEQTIIKALIGLGAALDGVGKLKESATVKREAVDRCRLVLGEEHHTTLTASNNLGSLLIRIGQCAEAENILSDVVVVWRRVFGDDDDLELVSAMRFLGDALKCQQKITEAREVYRSALGRVRSEKNKILFDAILWGLLDCEGILGNAAEAIRLERELLAWHRQNSPPNAESLHVLPADLGNRLLAVDSLEAATEAEGLLRECLETRVRVIPDSYRVPNTRNLLGYALAREAEFDHTQDQAARIAKLQEAERMMLESYDALKVHPGVPAPRLPGDGIVRNAVGRLIHLYDVWDGLQPGIGHDEQANRWRAELEKLTSSSTTK